MKKSARRRVIYYLTTTKEERKRDRDIKLARETYGYFSELNRNFVKSLNR